MAILNTSSATPGRYRSCFNFLLSWVGWLVGGWLKFLLILRLTQPSLAGVGAGAELGKKVKVQNSLGPQNFESKNSLIRNNWGLQIMGYKKFFYFPWLFFTMEGVYKFFMIWRVGTEVFKKLHVSQFLDFFFKSTFISQLFSPRFKHKPMR